jgi:RNA polymerase sigma factor (sigma-70 family)
MGDSEVVASVVAGEADGLAVAYDRYAGDLYGYCLSLLHEPDDAADAVQDTFVIAASKLSGLRERERLRAWLFAVARNECLHRLKTRRVAAPLQDAPEPADESADVGGAAERAETIALVRAAVGGLNDGERDVINQVWHGLEVPEVAAVLGVSRNHAYSLFSRAREQLAASVGVLLVGRAGRRDCAALDSLLGDWDGRLTARLRRRVGRHIDQCGTCSDRRRQELTPAMLYSLTPGAVLAMAGLRLAPFSGAAQLGGPLAGVRDAVLGLTGGHGPHAATLRIGKWQATGRSPHSFGANGFPRAPHGGHLAFLARPHLPLSVVSGTAVAATATVVVTVVAPHPRPAHDTHGSRPPVIAARLAGAPRAPAGSAGIPGASGRGTARAQASPAASTRSIHRGSGSVLGSIAAQVTVSPSATATGAGSALAGGSGVPAAGSATGAAGDPTTAVATGDPTTAVATATVAADGSTTAATRTVSPPTVLLSPVLGASLTLTAVGGPVSWSISVPPTCSATSPGRRRGGH